VTRRRVLFVTPCTHSSGEAVTALHVAGDLAARGVECWFAASAGAGHLLGPSVAGRIVALGDSPAGNQSRWQQAIRGLAPDAIVFADYPLLFFSSGTVPLADPRWVAALSDFAGALLTLDHVGYAQRRRAVCFGPPHLTFGAEVTVDLPERMEILLPCPTHEPGPVHGRKGVPVRCRERVPRHGGARRREVRRRYLDGDDGALVFHSVPGWASRLAAQLGLPHYRTLPALLQRYFSGLGRRVTIVSVSDGSLPVPPPVRDVRFVMMPALAPAEYEDLLAAADLMLTDNAVSASLGKAVCSLTPCALLRNTLEREALQGMDDPAAALAIAMERERPGSIFAFDVFPIWDADTLHDLGFDYAGGYGQSFARLELFGGEATRAAIASLLFDPAARAKLRDAQRRYLTAVAALPSAADAIAARIGVRSPRPHLRA
jgi:hypothetical protein